MSNSPNFPEYSTWENIRSRCSNPAVDSYKYYGAVGIKVCERWNSFENFFADMGKRPSRKFSIERIDSKKDYCPENCKWADGFEQSNNKSNNVRLEFNGESMNLFQWARKVGLPPKRLSARLKSGWSIERALTEPVKCLKPK